MWRAFFPEQLAYILGWCFSPVWLVYGLFEHISASLTENQRGRIHAHVILTLPSTAIDTQLPHRTVKERMSRDWCRKVLCA